MHAEGQKPLTEIEALRERIPKTGIGHEVRTLLTALRVKEQGATSRLDVCLRASQFLLYLNERFAIAADFVVHR